MRKVNGQSWKSSAISKLGISFKCKVKTKEEIISGVIAGRRSLIIVVHNIEDALWGKRYYSKSNNIYTNNLFRIIWDLLNLTIIISNNPRSFEKPGG